VVGTALGVPVVGTVIGVLSGAAIDAARKRTTGCITKKEGNDKAIDQDDNEAGQRTQGYQDGGQKAEAESPCINCSPERD
jgi:hypothetical protein